MAALRSPVQLMLAQAARDVPESRLERRWAFEPKFDGWRAALFTAGRVLQSRRETDLAARFPEVVDAGAQLGDVVLDGEVVALRAGHLDFGALTSNPRERPGAGVTIYFVAFDLLADSTTDLRSKRYRERRARLEQLFAGVTPPLQLAPSTTDRAAALAWMQPEVSAVGIEGIVAKLQDAPTAPAGRVRG
ncbi:hypothetical protein [Amycolatopsis tolypomycina]|uniref:ATP-dependent DNA ligase n=1 Tax=Amycolatopsis tolypomycina TaxID=208445 RepID=UPI00142E77E9|nr:hypothetical protein [Amycolatopsis tolypomycina]